MDDLQLLAPNYMGDMLSNIGLDELVKNRGLGVKEAMTANSQGMAQKNETTSQGSIQMKAKNDLRVKQARQFGTSKTQVGF